MAVNEADKEAFIEASGDIYAEFSTSLPEGKAMIEKAQALGKAN